MKETYLITGANGHLGNTLVRILTRKGKTVRGLLLPGEKPVIEEGRNLKYFWGDVRDAKSLVPFFEGLRRRWTIVIHTAGIVDISNEATENMMAVNVGGTRNVLQLCRDYHVDRLVYVSSVHAIPAGDDYHVLDEVNQFSEDKVVGGYAKTKAEATQLVMDAAREGLDAVVVQPSGILGPYDNSGNHLVQMVSDYVRGRLPAGVCGGYDFVDVRDVAKGCLAAAERGKTGECYILSNRHYDIRELFGMIRKIRGGRRVPTLPMWMARMSLPFFNLDAKRKKKRPLITKYSLYTLKSNDRFSHDKATKELGYHPRDLYRTLKDTIGWLGKEKKK